ncbi:hypothetical protein G7Y79_00006g019550 [Physcia stellaris]|nr:hypothetical protein G7Y79_00006g019550 [Physcia stellaris]
MPLLIYGALKGHAPQHLCTIRTTSKEEPSTAQEPHTAKNIHTMEAAPPSATNLPENWFSTAILVLGAAILMPRVVPKLLAQMNLGGRGYGGYYYRHPVVFPYGVGAGAPYRLLAPRLRGLDRFRGSEEDGLGLGSTIPPAQIWCAALDKREDLVLENIDFGFTLDEQDMCDATVLVNEVITRAQESFNEKCLPVFGTG